MDDLIAEARETAGEHGLAILDYQFEKKGKNMFGIKLTKSPGMTPKNIGRDYKDVKVEMPIDQKEDAWDLFLRKLQHYDTAKTGRLH
ncbi:hypothetical protein ACEPAG_1754 [Sanghuangporus baumii]